jgi:ligand-binding sensor protein
MLEYGIICKKDDEKQIVKNINKFLKKEYEYRKMYKRMDDSINKFDYEYKYCQFIRQKPRWYFELCLNEDRKGQWKFENKEAQWILFINRVDIEEYTKNCHVEVDLFFKKLIETIGFKVELLYEYKKDEERIGNIFDDD